MRAAQASLELAEQKMRRARMLVAQNFVSEQALEQARAELSLAREKLSQSRAQQRIWLGERQVAEAQLALRTVRSPFAGVVVERFVNAGERVEERPLMRVAVIDPLRVELMVPTAQYGAIAAGDTIVIHPELPGAAAVSATVSRGRTPVRRAFRIPRRSARSTPAAPDRGRAGATSPARANLAMKPWPLLQLPSAVCRPGNTIRVLRRARQLQPDAAAADRGGNAARSRHQPQRCRRDSRHACRQDRSTFFAPFILQSGNGAADNIVTMEKFSDPRLHRPAGAHRAPQRAVERGTPRVAAPGPLVGAPAVLRRLAALTLAASAAATLPALAAGPLGGRRRCRRRRKPFGCLIEPDRVADVGSQVVGLVERLAVERGDTVAAGQTLIALRADVERANAGVADTRARVDADVRAAQASLELAEQKMRRARMLVAQNFVSEQAVEQARAELSLAREKLSQSRAQQRIWLGERQVAEAQLALRTVRSPFAGVVVERFVNAGERVEERPLMRVAVIDPLRVELMVPTAQYGAIAAGDTIVIHPELPGAGAVSATVRHVDRVFDAASNSFRVRLSLPNPHYRLPAGLRCKADLPLAGLGKPPATAAAVAVPAPRQPPPAAALRTGPGMAARQQLAAR